MHFDIERLINIEVFINHYQEANAMLFVLQKVSLLKFQRYRFTKMGIHTYFIIIFATHYFI